MARKRSHEEAEFGDNTTDLKVEKRIITQSDHNAHEASMDSSDPRDEPTEDGAWQQVVSQGKKKRRKNPIKGSANYPSIHHSPNARLQSNVKISDLQNLILYVLAEGPAPQWVAVRHNQAIRRVVALTIPGFDPSLFTGETSYSAQPKPADTSPVPNNVNMLVDESNPKRESDIPSSSEQKDAPAPRSKKVALSPDDYYPKKLQGASLPDSLKPLAEIFPHIWPLKAPGDEKFAKIHSPLQAMLLTPIRTGKEDKKKKGPQLAKSNGFANQRTQITEYIASVEQLESNEYVLHPALFDTATARAAVFESRRVAKQDAAHGWVDTAVEQTGQGANETKPESDDLTAGRKIIAVDCEMCKTTDDQFELTRISVLNWDGDVILDALVKPDNPITDYLTPYSGITEEMLEPITTRLEDIQKRLQEIITPSTIIIGHSLDGDFKALHMTHPHIVDSAMLYPHPRGPPLKSSLKWLSQKYLGREIQKSHGTTGHDSVEDAKAVLDLVKQKCEKGPRWGTSEASSESLFVRLQKAHVPKVFRSNSEEDQLRTGAVVDWGNPGRGLGANADVILGCENDDDVAMKVKGLLHTDEGSDAAVPDFIWARFREVEAVRGWWERSKTSDNNEMRQRAHAKYSLTDDDLKDSNTNTEALSRAVSETVRHIADIYEALPPCTAFIVYSGHGDPREVVKMQALHQQFRHEYRTKKWDQLSVKWTDVEEQRMRKACRKAREAIGFITVK
jgi:RNA exonuclease 1